MAKWQFFDDRSRYLDRFGVLLLLTVLAVVVQSLVHMREAAGETESDIGTIVLTVLVGATFVVALGASGVNRRARRWADAFVMFSIVAVTIIVVVDAVTDIDVDAYRRDGPPLIRTALAIVTPVAVVRRLAAHRRISASTLIGAVSAYLLIALAFNYVFLTVDLIQSEPFFGEPEQSTSFMYFSLVTMTTLGYGDLVPVSDFARLTATFEAVISQVFLVTVVAMIVGQLIVSRRNER
jgi:hypothetical protein